MFQGQIQPGQLPIGDPGLSNGNEYGNIVPMGYNQQVRTVLVGEGVPEFVTFKTLLVGEGCSRVCNI